MSKDSGGMDVGAEGPKLDAEPHSSAPSGPRLKPAPPGLPGLQRIARAYGDMVIQGKHWVWDYAAETAVPEDEMPMGGERWRASERAKWCVDDGAGNGALRPRSDSQSNGTHTDPGADQ